MKETQYSVVTSYLFTKYNLGNDFLFDVFLKKKFENWILFIIAHILTLLSAEVPSNTSTMCKEHISTFNGPIQIMAFKEQKKPVVMM